MPYKDPELRRLSGRGSVRTVRHGNWRQTYIDCMGMCIAKVNGSGPCGEVHFLELHELFGENGHRSDPKFQIRVLLCNYHHSLIEDRGHQAEFMLWQYRPSILAWDVSREIELAGGYEAWVAKWNLDDSRFGCQADRGPYVEDYGDG